MGAVPPLFTVIRRLSGGRSNFWLLRTKPCGHISKATDNKNFGSRYQQIAVLGTAV